MSSPTTQKTFRVSLTVDGVDLGVWDTSTGGKLGANVLPYLPGGMGPQISLTGGKLGANVLPYLPGGMGPQISLPGGTPTIDTIQLARNYDLIRDHDSAFPILNAGTGRARCVVKKRPLDADGNGHGRSIVWTGTLLSVDSPATDSNSDSAAILTVEIAPDGPITLA